MYQKINYLSYAIIAVGIIIILFGLFTSIEIATFEDYYEPSSGLEEAEEIPFEWSQFYYSFIESLEAGIVTIGIGFISLILNQGNRLRRKQIKQLSSFSLSVSKKELVPSVYQREETWDIKGEDERKIDELYKDKAILEIHPTMEEGFVVVTLKDFHGEGNSYQRVVYISSEKAEEIKQPALVEKYIKQLNNAG
ncbi:hypothetical protein AQ616_10415 [Oceanobacillus sp. E9]|uniref:hypothetical protein n=1 Tax=Oceanobacillus TaxID=182709 RepID=UPI00034DA4A0|nr:MULTISPECIES: hypothetical protein [Oceanobacillus]OEH54168.1 hypothetical protein AQ616_10415 [Oceanobacillus sp. E9]